MARTPPETPRAEGLAGKDRFASGDLQASILSIAADESVDLLVMGGYGHSRLQETVFGGVTQETFRSMTVHVMMSH
ncbi:universal stress protein [Bradyrhizobium sp. CCGUVB1N3]|uniref:universal stress protein n=1 Tax=Bradyrhizobium sp. CCGUVB1N3 TaxID=2949629 RepID=UPI0035327921